jgi:ribosome biogenesis GTPase
VLLDLNLSALGYGPFFSDSLADVSSFLVRPDLVAARGLNLGSLVVIAGARSTHAELCGRLRHELAGVDRPTVGDWVAIADGATAADHAVIHHVLPRRTARVRRAAGTRGEPQAVAANVDTFGVVTSANRDANPRRLERYLAAIADSGADAVVVINKVDLSTPDEVAAVTTRWPARSALDLPIIATSAATGDGTDGLARLISPGRTIA